MCERGSCLYLTTNRDSLASLDEKLYCDCTPSTAKVSRPPAVQAVLVLFELHLLGQLALPHVGLPECFCPFVL
jgi:hypothetical protein